MLVLRHLINNLSHTFSLSFSPFPNSTHNSGAHIRETLEANYKNPFQQGTKPFQQADRDTIIEITILNH